MHFEATDLAARAAVQKVISELERTGLNTCDLSDVEIVLAEVINNIVEHAFAATDDGTVHLEYKRTKNMLSFTISDTGRGFENGAPPDGKLPELDGPRDALPEGGFGWMLIRELTTELTYVRRNGQNILKFSFRLQQRHR